MLYDSIYITFLKWQHYSHGEEMSDCHRLGMGEGWGSWLCESAMLYLLVGQSWRYFQFPTMKKCFKNYSVHPFFNQRFCTILMANCHSQSSQLPLKAQWQLPTEILLTTCHVSIYTCHNLAYFLPRFAWGKIMELVLTQ